MNHLAINVLIQNQLLTNSITESELKPNVRDLKFNCQDHAAILKSIYSCVTLERSKLATRDYCLVWVNRMRRVD